MSRAEEFMPAKWVLVDLDGTVCDTTHRAPILKASPKDDAAWLQHSMACGDDEPVEPVIRMVRTLGHLHPILIVTGRHEEAREATRDWLRRHKVPCTRLVMRVNGDRTPNGPFKVRAVEEIRATGHDVILAIEDYPKAAAALEEVGVPTVLVTSRSGF